MNYGKQLINLREDKGLKIQDVSKILNLEKDTYGKYEREYVTIPIKHLDTLAEYYDVSIDYLFCFTNDKKYKNAKKINGTVSSLRLKEFRKDNNLTQDKLSKMLNTDNSTISKYERNIHIISTPFLYEICKKYKISADYLLGKTDEPKYLK